MMSDIAHYTNYIESLASEHRNQSFLNSSKEHAITVLSTMFKYADPKKFIYIYSGDMNKGIADSTEYTSNLTSYLSKGGKVKILLESHDPNNEPRILKKLRVFKEIGLDVEVKQTGTRIYDTDTNKTLHFAVTDKAHRAEHDIDNFLAVGNFNDTEKSNILIKVFEDVYAKESNRAVI
ncbi:MAG: hypothetical protein HOP11_03520 [Saprospiraceae bacterium]|nr:hypothetical protein [Saprospiraceae bacterium]